VGTPPCFASSMTCCWSWPKMLRAVVSNCLNNSSDHVVFMASRAMPSPMAGALCERMLSWGCEANGVQQTTKK